MKCAILQPYFNYQNVGVVDLLEDSEAGHKAAALASGQCAGLTADDLEVELRDDLRYIVIKLKQDGEHVLVLARID